MTDSTNRPPRTAEDIHAGMLGHPRTLGARGCICGIKAQAEAAVPDAGLPFDDRPCQTDCCDEQRSRHIHEGTHEDHVGDGKWCIDCDVVIGEPGQNRAFPVPTAPDAGLREALERLLTVLHWVPAGGTSSESDAYREASAALAAHRSSDPSPAPAPDPDTLEDIALAGHRFRWRDEGNYPEGVFSEDIESEGAAPAGPAVDREQLEQIQRDLPDMPELEEIRRRSERWEKRTRFGDPGPAEQDRAALLRLVDGLRLVSRSGAAGPAVDMLLPWHRYEGDHDCWIAGCDKAAVDVPAAFDVERLAEAGANVLDGFRVGTFRLFRNTITHDTWNEIAGEYARLQSPDPSPEQLAEGMMRLRSRDDSE